MTEINKLIFSVAAGMCKQKQQKKLTLFSSRKRNEHSLVESLYLFDGWETLRVRITKKVGKEVIFC